MIGPEALERVTEGYPRPLERDALLREMGHRELQVAPGRWIALGDLLAELPQEEFADGEALAAAASARWREILERSREP